MTILYLAAIVAANLIITQFGPSASVLTAFLLIGLVITTRDRLHDAWYGNGLRWKMTALIAAGGLLSYLLNADAARIAVASFAAFAVSESLDAALYHYLRDRDWYVRVNGSNTLSAAADSVLFPTLAFGLFLPWVILGQFAAKVFGGAIWSWILRPRARAIFVLLLFVPTVAVAQIVSVGAGSVVTDYGTSPVAEVYVAAPIVGPVRPYVIGSWTLDPWDAEPLVLTEIDMLAYIGSNRTFSVGTGAKWASWNDYRPRWIMSATFVWKPSALGIVAIAAAEPVEPEQWAIVLKADYTIKFWR